MRPSRALRFGSATPRYGSALARRVDARVRRGAARAALVLVALALQACAWTPAPGPAPRSYHPLRDAELPYEVGGLWTRPRGYGRVAQDARGYHRYFPPTQIHEAAAHLWDARCEMHFDTAYAPPARHVCRYEAVADDDADVSVVLLGDDLRRLDGLALATTATTTTLWALLHDPARRAVVVTSSTATLIARVDLDTGALEVAPDLTVDENRFAELIGLAVLAVPRLAPLRPPTTPKTPQSPPPDDADPRIERTDAIDPNEALSATTATSRDELDEATAPTEAHPSRTSTTAPRADVPTPRYPDARPLRTTTATAPEPFARHARHLAALGNTAHAAALLASIGFPLDGPPKDPGRPVPEPAAPPRSPIAFGVGLEAGPTFPLASGDVRLKHGAELRVPLFMEIDRRLQLVFFVGTYSRLLDGPGTLDANALGGTLVALDGYARDGTNVNGVASLGIGGRYFFGADWALQPYAGLFGATRFEAHQFVDAARTFRVDVLLPALEVTPVAGARHALWRGDFLDVDLRGELALHTIFMRRPVLDFEGDASAAALDTYERLRALDFGGPALQLAFLIAVDVSFGGR